MYIKILRNQNIFVELISSAGLQNARWIYNSLLYVYILAIYIVKIKPRKYFIDNLQLQFTINVELLYLNQLIKGDLTVLVKTDVYNNNSYLWLGGYKYSGIFKIFCSHNVEYKSRRYEVQPIFTKKRRMKFSRHQYVMHEIGSWIYKHAFL